MEVLGLYPDFIQDLDQRPKLEDYDNSDRIATVELPVIDLSLPLETDGIVSKVGQACKEWGFFQIINHGVSPELVAKVENHGRRFFELPAEEKRKSKRDEENAMGYHDAEHTKNIRDWKEVFDFLVEDHTIVPASCDADDHELRTLVNQWPLNPPEFREVCQEYAREVEKLAHRLLGLIEESLGMPKDKLNGLFNKEQTSFVRLNYYPACPIPGLALGVGRHKDAGALTILSQDSVGGLQIRRKSDQQWIPVTPTPLAFVVNVGDIIQVWSNDKYESVEHRVVVNSVKERFSMPFFFFPGHQVMVKPFEEILSNEDSPRYKEYNWGKFLAHRYRSDFKKRPEDNIQIQNFKIE